MDLIYVMLILLVCLIIIGILCYLLINKNQSKETITEEKSENSMVVKDEQPSYFPAIQIIENNDIIINENKITSLSDYESRIEKINSSINIINTSIGEITPPLQEEINNKYDELIGKINAVDNTESITNLQVRISKIENNLFGSNETIEHNRIDNLEAKVNDIYNRLTSIGILPKEE